MGESLAMMPWFPRDFLASTRGWSLIQKACYRELLDAQWDLGVLPDDPDELQALCGATPKQWFEAWEKVCTKFVAVQGGLKNERLELHRQKYVDIRQARAAAGRKGGQAKAVANASNCQSVATDLPEQTSVTLLGVCSTSIPSEEKSKNKNPETGGVFSENQDPDDFLIWTSGIELLGESKRSLMGKLVQTHGKETVARKLGEIMAMSERPRDPAGYFIGALRKLERRFQP